MALERFYIGFPVERPLELEVIGAGVAEGDPDLSTVTAMFLQINKPGMAVLEEDVWIASVDATSEFSVLAHYDFELGDLDREGTYRVMMLLAMPGYPAGYPVGPVIFEGLYRG
jgi:hypothetical protein